MSPARVYPRRAPGYLYAGTAVLLLIVVGTGATSYAGDGRYAFAVAVAVVGLGVAGFLGVLGLSILLPVLTLDEAGVHGRAGWGRIIALGWDQVGIDHPEDAAPSTFRFDLGGEPLSIHPRSWVGYRAAMLLVASHGTAADRLTPAARTELGRLLGLTQPEAQPEAEPEAQPEAEPDPEPGSGRD